MCLIVFSWQPETNYPLTFCANRDEFFQRPTASLEYWEDNPRILGERDLQAGGSWLAVSQTGRLAAVTNYREFPAVIGKLSRGSLVTDFLNSSQTAQAFLEGIQSKNKSTWPGFNLLVADRTGLFYYSNRSDQVLHLEPGLYGLSNHLLDSPWPKVQQAKEDLRQFLDKDNFANPKGLVKMMRNPARYPDQQLPRTGIPLAKERLLSSCFISSPDYGTRNTSILTVYKQGRLDWHEQLYGPGGQEDTLDFDLNFPVDWSTAG